MSSPYLQKFFDNSINFVETASFCVKRACDEIGVHRQMQKKASDLAMPLLEHLIEIGAVPREEKAAAAAMLGDHASTLQLLKNAADQAYAYRTGKLPLAGEAPGKSAGDLGRGVDGKTAGVEVPGEYDSTNSPFVGRHTSQKKASDLAILKVLEPPSV